MTFLNFMDEQVELAGLFLEVDGIGRTFWQSRWDWLYLLWQWVGLIVSSVGVVGICKIFPRSRRDWSNFLLAKVNGTLFKGPTVATWQC